MEYLHSDCINYCRKEVIDKINHNFSKVVGIESNLNIINENKKYVGRIILLSDAPKLYLNQIVEFNTDKIKWKSFNNENKNGFYIINRYWVKSYAPMPKIKVPVYIFDVSSNSFVIEIVELNYYQFRKRKLMEFYRTWKHVVVAAYENFNRLIKNNQYYFALNSTIKIYGIEEEDLLRALSIIDNEKKKIKKEWNIHLNNHFQQNHSAKMINKLYKRTPLKEKNNIVMFKKQGIL